MQQSPRPVFSSENEPRKNLYHFEMRLILQIFFCYFISWREFLK